MQGVAFQIAAPTFHTSAVIINTLIFGTRYQRPVVQGLLGTCSCLVAALQSCGFLKYMCVAVGACAHAAPAFTLAHDRMAVLA